MIQDRLEEFKDLVWQEMPNVLERLRETAPDYARAFELFYLRHQKDPANDTFFFNTTSFLVIASQAGALYSGYMMRVIENSPVLKKWLDIEGIPVSCCMLLGYPAVHYQRTAPRKTGNIVWW